MLVEVNHPLVRHHLARLRDRITPPAEFRQLVHRLAALLAYEATQDLELRSVEVETPLATTTAQVLSERVGIVPILRAGAGHGRPDFEPASDG
jgi:uracil phosphoribosyltransferase